MSGAVLAALQLADSALPIGRFVHSHGVEAWLAAHPDAGEAELGALVAAVVADGVAPLDGAVLAHAHRADTIDDLLELDEMLAVRKLTPSARLASQACGRQLAGLAVDLTGDPLVGELAAHVAGRRTAGNVAVVHGALARALEVAARDAVLIELRGAAAGFLSAAVRLGRLPPARAQVAQLRLAPAIGRAADEALALERSDVRSGAFELEVWALVHRRADVRFFST